MKRLVVLLIIIIAFSSLFYGQFKRKKQINLPPLTKEEISGEVLFNRVTVEDPYKNYSWWPGHEGVQAGQTPHGSHHEIFINSILREALPIKNGPAPYGSIIVKLNMNYDRELENFTIMAKVKGYNPENNDWFWLKASKEGKIIAEGAVQSCIKCHIIKKDNDYIVVRGLDRDIN